MTTTGTTARARHRRPGPAETDGLRQLIHPHSAAARARHSAVVHVDIVARRPEPASRPNAAA